MAGLEFRLISTEIGMSLELPKPLDRAVKIDEDVAEVFRKVAAQTGNKKIERLLISSHAYVEGGKFTIFLGSVGKTKGIRIEDVGVFAPLAGKFAHRLRGIEIQACNVADNNGGDPRSTPNPGSAAAFSQAIANITQTGVLASTLGQKTKCQEMKGEYTVRGPRGLPETIQVTEVTDCQDIWTGNLWMFTPGGRGAAPHR